jgi:hypothetical protein
MENGFEFGKVTQNLLKSGHIHPDDPRLLSDICSPNTHLSVGRKSFIAQAEFHLDRAREVSGKIGARDPLQSRFALSSKLIGSLKSGASHTGMEAGFIAVGMEETALLLWKRGHSDKIVGGMIRFSARATDRVILSQRSNEFDGLVSTMALKNDYSMPSAAHDLIRLGLVEPNDPRLDPKIINCANMANQLQTGDFLAGMKSHNWSDMSLLSKIDDPFSQSSIIKDTALLLEQQCAPHKNSETAKHKKQADFMATMGRISERMAVNLSWGGQDPTMARSSFLLGNSVSAVERSRIYAMRARNSEKDKQDKNRSSQNRDRMM